MTDDTIRSTYDDFLLDSDDEALFAVVRAVEVVYARVQPPTDIAGRPSTPVPDQPARTWRATRLPMPFVSLRRLRRSGSLALLVACFLGLVGGGAYAMHLFGAPSGPRVVLSCEDFGARWHLVGSGAYLTSPQAFAASGGRLSPGWQRQVARLQNPQYWNTPANADIVDTCRGSSSDQVLIGTNNQLQAQLIALRVVPLWLSNSPTMVGSLRIPSFGGCTLRPVTVPVRVPDHRVVAQLAHVPANTRSVRAIFPPCNVSKRPVSRPRGAPPAVHDVGFRIISQIEYRSSQGTIVVLTARPTAAAARPGLNLGNPVGRLANGTRLWDLHCAPGGCAGFGEAWTNDVRWMSGSLIISVSGNTSVQKLRSLASDIMVR